MLTPLLRPFSALYGLLTDVRNQLYTNRFMSAFQPVQYCITVGNLTVGGTGKTPMVEYLIRRLSDQRRLAMLSRGYGRQTRGFRIAGLEDTAETLGDEPLQVYRKFGNSVTVCVGEQRAAALSTLSSLRPDIDTVILDDAFQHRAVAAHVNLLLSDYNRPFYTDHPFPAGRLRERRHGARRADAVIVTKCPDDLPLADQQKIASQIRPYTRPGTPVFFAGLRYDTPVSYAGSQPDQTLREVVLVSGIASVVSLEAYVRRQFRLIRHLEFGDHHAYSSADLDRIRQGCPPGTAVLTTEKDWVKLQALLLTEKGANPPFYYVPVAMYLLDREEELMQLLRVKKPE
ncbi:tetraacyldisaccharide 4'-kinase [Nibrella saemangeumensis]|uniref:Tetraacyldisaccharide 4'-kinase n=1 Tax=Nibrella saemangeumensis TaxID=1084526 RepID=A0ABP8NCU0_9BACT